MKSFILDVIMSLMATLVSFDVLDSCDQITMTSCPFVTLESGENIQYIAKPMPSTLEWVSRLPADLELSGNVERFYCTEPACLSDPCQNGGSCTESRTGFICLCYDWFLGERCDYDARITTLMLVGGNPNEGRIVFTSMSNNATYLRVHQNEWSSNSSHLACQYLGFQGAFVTVSGALYNSSSVESYAKAVSVTCPTNATNITECWHNVSMRDNIEESIGIVCCPVNPCNIPGQPLGIENGLIPDSSITATSCYPLAQLCTQNSRLDGLGAWVPNDGDLLEWIQVQFQPNAAVTAITTQGRSDYGQWMTSYTLSSSVDGVVWTDHLNVYSGSIEVFPGNYNHHGHVTHILMVPIVAHSIRIHPKTYYSRKAIRFELYGYAPFSDTIAMINHGAKLGCTPPLLGEALGMEDGRIPDSSITSSSIFGPLHEPYWGRLNRIGDGTGVGAWVAANADPNKWIKIDVGENVSITGVISQGRWNFHGVQKVTALQISYSTDDAEWTFALEDQCGVRKTYAANFDEPSHVTIVFPAPVRARYIRLHPITYTAYASMRCEILGIHNL